MTAFGLFRALGLTGATVYMGALLVGPAVALDAGQQQWAWMHSSTEKQSKISVPAADRRTVTTRHGAWQVTCDEAEGESVCSAAFKVIDRNRNATILTWMLGHNSAGELLAEFFVPTEVLISPGVTLSIDDGQSYTADYVACGQSACKATLPVSAPLAQDLRGAESARIAITSSRGEVTEFSMGIAGIDAAMAALER